MNGTEVMSEYSEKIALLKEEAAQRKRASTLLYRAALVLCAINVVAIGALIHPALQVHLLLRQIVAVVMTVAVLMTVVVLLLALRASRQATIDSLVVEVLEERERRGEPL